MKYRINIPLLSVALLFLAGIGILSYPAICSFLNERHSSYAIQELQDALDKHSDEALSGMRKKAESYNAMLRGDGLCSYAYEDILDFGDGIMGYIEIPSIRVHLPIYHGTSETVLAKGIGHIPDTAFPIGGLGNHSALSGHTGLPSAKLFTHLDQLKEGDRFYIHILDDVVTYEVDQIRIILPTELGSIQPIPHEDYCTLITCTPYGINSHRLLVRGKRM